MHYKRITLLVTHADNQLTVNDRNIDQKGVRHYKYSFTSSYKECCAVVSISTVVFYLSIRVEKH